MSTTSDPERSDLLAELSAARAALLGTVAGLTDDQAGLCPTASGLCLGGLIKHVAATEDAWARFIHDGPSAMSFDMPEGVTWADFMSGTATQYPQWAIDRMNDFQMLPGDSLTSIVAQYQEVAARTDEMVRTLPDLSVSHLLPDAPWNEPGASHTARRVLIHIVAETTQHAGHADILRESIDGHTAT